MIPEPIELTRRPGELTPEEKRLRTLLRILALLFLVAVFGYSVPALLGPNKDLFVNLPFVTNSAVKVAVLGLLAYFAAADVRRYRRMTWLLIAGHVISELVVAATLTWGDAGRLVDFVIPFTGNVVTFPISGALIGSMVLDGVIIALLIWFFVAAERAYYDLKYLTPMTYRSLVALSGALIEGRDEKVRPEELARNADRYLDAFQAQTKWVFNLVLAGMEIYPLLSLKPPLTEMAPADRRRFLEDRFYRRPRRLTGLWRTATLIMIRVAKQLAYLGYYSNEKTWDSIGYVPFSERPDTEARKLASPPVPEKPLTVRTFDDIREDKLRRDIVIIGSGAAASVLAHAILRDDTSENRRITMIERGHHTPPSAMNESEIEMLSRLYAEGALQLTRDFSFQVLQGSCVGGTTVVNNAVSFPLPQDVLDRWNDEHAAGLDPARLAISHESIDELLEIETQPPEHLNPGAQPFIKGVDELQLDLPGEDDYGIVAANIRDCYGCGYCNIGCQFGKKLSMLDVVLPRIQEQHGDRLEIIAGCRAEKLRGTGRQVTGVRCELRDEDDNKRRIEIEANVIVVAAGAVSSSLILIESGVAVGRAGKRLSFNMGSPMTGVFDDVQNAYAGLQISHFLLRPERGFVMETWFNPPVAQALTMPGWFDQHFDNMRRYGHMSSVGVLVPTASEGVVSKAGLFGRDIDYTPNATDLGHLADGLILAGEIFLEGDASSVMPHTFDYHEWTDKRQLEQLRTIVQKKDAITLGTGHPQGGNVMSKHADRSVVDPEFRVHGYDNLYVCDASVFPTSVGVNPQVAVMALADYAAPFVSQNTTRF